MLALIGFQYLASLPVVWMGCGCDASQLSEPFFMKCFDGLFGQNCDDCDGDFGKNGGPVHDESPFENDWERRKGFKGRSMMGQ